MLTEFRLATFDGCLNTEFQIIENQATVCVLQLTDLLERVQTPRQEAFSLIFHGPSAPFVPQGTYLLKHSQLGELELFLVPVAREKDGFQYEAAFNLLI